MIDEEKKRLESAILTMADPKGNWSYGWSEICALAGLDPKQYTPPFKPSEFVGYGNWIEQVPSHASTHHRTPPV
jgi:hypothetical protein